MIPVKILATCTNPELIRATTLVFDTLRTGFPSAEVTVYWNGMDRTPQYDAVYEAARTRGEVDHFFATAPTIHYEWIERLLAEADEPFYICDTDMVFWGGMECFSYDTPLAGRYVPQFYDQFTRCVTRPRLHTCLLYLDPARIEKATKEYFAQFPDTPFNPRPNLIRPGYIPWRQGNLTRSYFWDTCCLLYNAIGGRAFTEQQLNCFDHLQSGTISDDVGHSYSGLRVQHFLVLNNPRLLRGAWRNDDQFYARHAA